jgi:hypothetical protein
MRWRGMDVVVRRPRYRRECITIPCGEEEGGGEGIPNYTKELPA